MIEKEQFDFFVEEMLNSAVKEFRSTEQYKLLQEKLDHMDSDCEFILNPGDREFTTECFELIMKVDGQQEQHVYRQGLMDGIRVLKWLGVLP